MDSKPDATIGATGADLLTEFVERRRKLLSEMDRSKIQEKLERTIDFLELLRRGGPWQLSAINPNVDDDIITRTIRSIDHARRFLYEHNGKRNLYYSVNPVKLEHRKAKKTDITAIEYLPCDLDPKDDEAPEAAKTRYRDALKSFHTPPTFAVDSGNGLNVLWRFDQPIMLPKPLMRTDPKTRKSTWVLSPEAETIIGVVEGGAKAAMEALGSIAGTQNIDRILRLPWTINIPTRTKRAKGRMISHACLLGFDDVVCSLKDFPVGTTP